MLRQKQEGRTILALYPETHSIGVAVLDAAESKVEAHVYRTNHATKTIVSYWCKRLQQTIKDVHPKVIVIPKVVANRATATLRRLYAGIKKLARSQRIIVIEIPMIDVYDALVPSFIYQS